MENLKWLQQAWEKSKAFVLLALVLAALYVLGKYVVPLLFNEAKNANAAQLELMKQELAACRMYGQNESRLNDSLRMEISKRDHDLIIEGQKQNAALRAAAEKYQDAIIKIREAETKVNNLNKKVSNEIQ